MKAVPVFSTRKCNLTDSQGRVIVIPLTRPPPPSLYPPPINTGTMLPPICLILFLHLALCAGDDFNCSSSTLSRRYIFAENGLVDTAGGPPATQLNVVAPVEIDNEGAHFTNDSYANAGGGNDGAGLSLGSC
jgi:hypothetical protein